MHFVIWDSCIVGFVQQVYIRPVIIEFIVRFSGRGVPHRKMSRITGVSTGGISNDLRPVRDSSSLTQGLRGRPFNIEKKIVFVFVS